MRFLAVATLAFFASLTAHAGEFFPDGKPASLERDAFVDGLSTVGGYPIYAGHGSWQFVSSSVAMSGTFSDAESIKRGTLVVYEVAPINQLSAVMVVTANLSTTGVNQYVTGSPCAGNHLIQRNKSQRQDDNCLTVNATAQQFGKPNATYFSVQIIQTQSAGRLYAISLHLSADVLGFSNTSPAEWNPIAIDRSPARKAFVEKLRVWAEQLQDAANQALDFKKPQDAFVQVPSYRTLRSAANDVTAALDLSLQAQ
jgi:hypothetical protein